MDTSLKFDIGQLLARPIFRSAKLAAGREGMHRPVGWVHVLEITNVAPFVSPNDLILTTGLWLKQNEQDRFAYMKQLIDQHAAGLCIEMKTTVDAIPKEIVELADQHQFPLIVFEQPVRFVEITQDIHALLINRQHQFLKELEVYSRKLQRLTIESTGIAQILRAFHEQTGRQVLYFSSLDHSIFYPALTTKASSPISGFLQRQMDAKALSAKDVSMLPMNAQQLLVVQPVICFGQTFSYVGVLLHNKPEITESLTLLLDYTTKAVAAITLRTEFLEEKLSRDHNEFILDIMNNRIENEDQALSRMGLRQLSKGEYLFAGGIIEIQHTADSEPITIEADKQDLLILVRQLLKKLGLNSLVMMQNNRIYTLCAREALHMDSPSNFQATLLRLIEELRESTREQHSSSLKLYAGFGKLRAQISESARSYEEAQQVIDVARSVPAYEGCMFYDRLGVYQLLKAVPKLSFLAAYVEDHLGALLAYDREHHLQLIETLDAYFACMGSKQETAARLHIHRQTLYNRLDKLAMLLGEDFLETDKRRCLEMALMAYKLK
ncbi:PucR family transcriptional regulator [Paenibacillus montanisoli]|uniref:PucR family transcriptional regulator n=1 Tax=Paenibacillus montanisoli TaxID=2081970 RepID=A0A328U0T3_9BACL|nr:PucR family transcriptional regulator [Paenibacillus montanisoli]RAP73596.1 PucR family transcriptional regulator [Paenibacillus montanisoli]